jgi:hypothetical protein
LYDKRPGIQGEFRAKGSGGGERLAKPGSEWPTELLFWLDPARLLYAREWKGKRRGGAESGSGERKREKNGAWFIGRRSKFIVTSLQLSTSTGRSSVLNEENWLATECWMSVDHMWKVMEARLFLYVPWKYNGENHRHMI